MSRDTLRIFKWLHRHKVPKNCRRIIGLLWTVLRNITAEVFRLIRSRSSFTSAMVIAVIAAYVLASVPFVGSSLLAPSAIILGVVLGLVEEFSQSLRVKRKG